ncbi:hypothetical protein [Paraburkholderia sp. BR14320]|uniref:hypothetical protein n=1 Tax=unclassified Paraburkholderia TaxID=2615204 RepID=UPI0034CE173B
MNVDTTDEPPTRKAGERPVCSERDSDDVAAFLQTLTDGFDLKAKAAGEADRKTRRVMVTLDLKDKNGAARYSGAIMRGSLLLRRPP